jgi:hypothetical protein
MHRKKGYGMDRSWIAAPLFLLFLSAPLLHAQDSKPAKTTNAATQAADLSKTASALYLKVRVPEPVKVNRLKPGQTIQGTLAPPVYSGSKELFPAGSKISMTAERSLALGGESLHAPPRKLSDL